VVHDAHRAAGAAPEHRRLLDGSGASARRVKQLEEALRQKENREKVAAPPELPAVQPAW